MDAGRGKEAVIVRPSRDTLLLALALLLMLGGAVVLVADVVHPAISIPAITAGIALTVLIQARRQRQLSSR
jgi:hypothetical protein